MRAIFNFKHSEGSQGFMRRSTFADEVRADQNMGIPGLLPAIKSAMKPVHIRELSGTCVAVDTYSWLHKASFCCARELCRGIPTRRHIDYCMHKVNLLRHHGVKPILVFDGGTLPMKAEQEAKRARSRKENLDRAIEHELCGNHSAAYECYQKAVDISPLIAYQLIEVLRREAVDYVVAPYEADAQMAYLSVKNHVSAVITEDSDLIPFGCSRIIFKLDKDGNGDDFQYTELANNKGLNFSNFTKDMLLEMCILSGCDYLPSLPGVGIKKAHDLVRRFRCYKKIIKHMKYNGISVPASYEVTFSKAMLAFRHQLVYDCLIEDVVHLTEFPSNLESDTDVFGPSIPKDLAKAIATGEVDPISKKAFHEETSTFMDLSNGFSEKNGTHRQRRKRALELPVQKNVMTNYFCSTSAEAKRQFKAPRVMPSALHISENLFETTDQNIELSKEFSKIRSTDENSPELGFQDSKHLSYSEILEDVQENHKVTKRKHVATKDVEFLSRFIYTGSANNLTDSELTCNMEYSNLCKRRKEDFSGTFPFGNKIKTDVHSTKSVSCFEDASELSHDAGFRIRESYETDDQASSAEKAGSVQTKAEPCDSKDDRDSNHNFKGKHVPTFKSNLIGKKMVEDKFACNLSHLEKYTFIAEKSVEKLASTISFKSNRGGARVSGLREPGKLSSTQRLFSNSSQMALLDKDFGKFAYQPDR